MTSLKVILDGTDSPEEKYIPDFKDLEVLVRLLREAGYSIVLTQGVYDLFHVGHNRYLRAASKFSDILIVGVDSDELTRNTKGKVDPDRPFDKFESRIEMIGSMSFVDIVTRRHIDQDTDDLIKLVRPDVLVISKTTTSFTPEKIEELKRFCGSIEHLEAQADPSLISTTAKVERLRKQGARELGDLLAKTARDFLEGKVNG